MEGLINELDEISLDQNMKWREREQELLAENKSHQERDEQRTAEESLREAKWKEKEMSWFKERKEFVKRERMLKHHIIICRDVFELIYDTLIDSDEETEDEEEKEEDDGIQETMMQHVRENIQDFFVLLILHKLIEAESDFELLLVSFHDYMQRVQEEEEGSLNPSVEASAHQQIPEPVESQLKATDSPDTEAPKNHADQGYSTMVLKEDTSSEEGSEAAGTQKIVRRKKKCRRMRRNKRH